VICVCAPLFLLDNAENVMTRVVHFLFGCFVAVAPASVALAQQTSAEVHGNYVRALSSHSNAWGAGANYQVTWGSEKAPLRLATSVGPDYTKQQGSDQSQASLSFDATLQPGGGGAATPYAGGSVSENWRAGAQRQWSGGKVGTEVVAGVQVKIGNGGRLSAKGEERYGYVNGQEHTATTRLGVSMSF
jgi:hypothetical protein